MWILSTDFVRRTTSSQNDWWVCSSSRCTRCGFGTDSVCSPRLCATALGCLRSSVSRNRNPGLKLSISKQWLISPRYSRDSHKPIYDQEATLSPVPQNQQSRDLSVNDPCARSIMLILPTVKVRAPLHSVGCISHCWDHSPVSGLLCVIHAADPRLSHCAFRSTEGDALPGTQQF